MNDEKKELKVAALENGTVIDHIPSSQLFKVVSILGLENCTNSITIGNFDDTFFPYFFTG